MKCLRSLQRQTVVGFHVTVVDDGSTDGTGAAVRAEFPSVTILQGDGNLWWAAAMNMGIEHAIGMGAQYVLSLNDDLEVRDDYMEKMIFWAEQKPDALFGSYVFDIHTKRPYSASRRVDWRTGKSHSLLTIVPEEDRRGLCKATDLPGIGLWVPSEVFSAIGLFDAKHLPHYGADNDFTLRAGEHGFEVYCNFDALLYSYVEASGQYECRKTYSLGNYWRYLFGIKSAKNLRNFTIIAFRHCPKRYLLWFWVRGVVRQTGAYVIDWVRSLWRDYATR